MWVFAQAYAEAERSRREQEKADALAKQAAAAQRLEEQKKKIATLKKTWSETNIPEGKKKRASKKRKRAMVCGPAPAWCCGFVRAYLRMKFLQENFVVPDDADAAAEEAEMAEMAAMRDERVRNPVRALLHA